MSDARQQLNEALTRARAWFMEREPRERMALTIGAAIVACAVVYVAAFLPLDTVVATRSKRIEQKQNDLAWMQAIAPQLSSFSANTAMRNNSESMVVLIANAATSGNVSAALTGQTPDGPNGVRVRFEGVQFDALVVWLGTLQKDYGIHITAAELSRTPQSGLVNAALSLQRGV
jgi:general secretion pathway protein M